MSLRVISDPEYKNWIGQLTNRYRAAQIKAAVAVNSQMLRFYCGLGRDMVDMQSENKYGSKLFQNLSRDLKEAILDAKGLSSRNLRYIERFYRMYVKILYQLGAEFEVENCQQLGDDFNPPKERETIDEFSYQNLHQIGAKFLHVVGNSKIQFCNKLQPIY